MPNKDKNLWKKRFRIFNRLKQLHCLDLLKNVGVGGKNTIIVLLWLSQIKVCSNFTNYSVINWPARRDMISLPSICRDRGPPVRPGLLIGILNIQLTYSPTFASNHLDIAHSLIAMIDRNFGNLIQNVPEPYRYNSAAIGRSSSPDMISPVYVQKGLDNEAWDDGRKELGNLTWMLHSYYQYYRYTMDTAVYDRLFPLLKRAINYYIHLLEKDNNGKYHISVRTYSPEYPQGYAYDTNYDLSILKWGLKTLIALDGEREGNDKFRGQWSDILDNLRPYPQDSTGFMIAKDLPYA